MKDKQMGNAIECIRNLIEEAKDSGRQSDEGWSELYMDQAKVEALLLLTRVIQERPL